MAVNYGIGFCKQVLKNLQEAEDKLFEEKGHGFDMFGEQFATERRYRRLLKQFEREKEKGLPPSYDPEVHGSLS